MQTSLSCQLFVLYQSQTMVLVHARSPGTVSLSYSEGSCISTLSSNPGLLLLTHCTGEVQELIIKEVLKGEAVNPTKREQIINNSESFRKKPLIWRESLHVNGIRELVGLVGQHEGKQIGALTLSDVSGIDKLNVNLKETVDVFQNAIKKLTYALGL